MSRPTCEPDVRTALGGARFILHAGDESSGKALARSPMDEAVAAGLAVIAPLRVEVDRLGYELVETVLVPPAGRRRGHPRTGRSVLLPRREPRPAAVSGRGERGIALLDPRRLRQGGREAMCRTAILRVPRSVPLAPGAMLDPGAAYMVEAAAAGTAWPVATRSPPSARAARSLLPTPATPLHDSLRRFPTHHDRGRAPRVAFARRIVGGHAKLQRSGRRKWQGFGS